MDKFSHRFRFYSIGFVIGLFFLIIFLNQRSSCMNYFPNGRVLTEMQGKKIIVDSAIEQQLKSYNKPNNWVRDSLLMDGDIDFDKSEPRAKPCSKYYIEYQNMEAYVTKCKDEVILTKINRLQPKK